MKQLQICQTITKANREMVTNLASNMHSVPLMVPKIKASEGCEGKG